MLVISTMRLSLRAVDQSDRRFLDDLQRRPEVPDFVGLLGIPQLGEGDHLFAILENDERVGVVGVVKSMALEGSDVELLCVLSPFAEGRGLATEACRAVIAWARSTGAWTRLLACVHDRNPRSRALVARLGFELLTRRSVRDEDIFAFALGGAA